jgi:hypothetical protein
LPIPYFFDLQPHLWPIPSHATAAAARALGPTALGLLTLRPTTSTLLLLLAATLTATLATTLRAATVTLAVMLGLAVTLGLTAVVTAVTTSALHLLFHGYWV